MADSTSEARPKPDRRTTDRRVAQEPFDGPERRAADRRSGRERRGAVRLA